VIDYSSSARDVPSSTPTARCQTKRTPFFFPPLCFSRSRALAFVLASTFHVVIDRGPCAHRDADGRVFRRTSVRGAEAGLFRKFTKRQIEVTFPKHSRFDGNHIFYSILYTFVFAARRVGKSAPTFKNTFSKTRYRELAASSIYPAY